MTLRKEIIQFLLLFFTTIFFVYFTPKLVNQLYFLSLLVLFWRSKRNYYWFAFIFVIINEPAFLFHGGLNTDVYRIPFYNITSGFSFGFYDLFFLTAFTKALVKGNKEKLLLEKPLQYLFVYLIFLFLLSMIVGFGSVYGLTGHLRNVLPFTLFISIPYLISKKENYFRMANLLFVILFFILLTQLFYLTYGIQFGFLLEGTSFELVTKEIISGVEDETLLRTRACVTLTLFCMIISMILLSTRENVMNRKYLISIIITSLVTIVLTATRSWMIVFLIIIAFYVFYVERISSKIFIRFFMIISIILILYLSVQTISSQVDNAFKRLSSVEELAKGDVTAGGTLKRIDIRLPAMLRGYNEAPFFILIFGSGFSKWFDDYADYHVSLVYMFFQSGIIGTVLFIYLWIRYLKIISYKNLRYNIYARKSLRVLKLSFFVMLLLQFTTFSLFAFTLHPIGVIFIVLFISFSEIAVKDAWKEEQILRKIRNDLLLDY